MIVRVLSVGAVVAVVTAGVLGWSWWRAAHDDAARYGQARDEVLAAGQHQVVVLNSVDYRRLDADLARWREAATGPLLERLHRNEEADRRSAVTVRTVAGARVVGAAVTTLNTHTGSAAMIAAVEVTVSQNEGAAARKVSRLDLGLVRTAAGWKVSGLEVVGT